MRRDPHVLLIAGDPSADRHGAALVDALRAKCPEVRISALGGGHLREKADAFAFALVGVGGFGFWEPLLKLPQLWRAWTALQTILKRDPPDLVIPMDYYGFNIRAAASAHRRGIPVVYYISPQVWASRPHRIRRLASVIQKMLVIFPFEVDLYKKAGVPVSFVGHPLTERLPSPAPESATPLLGLLPGSRRAVIERHLPLLIQTAAQLRQDIPHVRCILFRPEEIEEAFYLPFMDHAPWIELQTDPLYETRRHLWLAIGVSGTAALENTLLGIPMIIMYKLSCLTYWIAKRLIRVPYVGIPNLLAGRQVVPELLQAEATPERLATAAKPLLSSSALRSEMRRSLLSLRALLREGGTARAADEILGMLI